MEGAGCAVALPWETEAGRSLCVRGWSGTYSEALSQISPMEPMRSQRNWEHTGDRNPSEAGLFEIR